MQNHQTRLKNGASNTASSIKQVDKTQKEPCAVQFINQRLTINFLRLNNILQFLSTALSLSLPQMAYVKQWKLQWIKKDQLSSTFDREASSTQEKCKNIVQDLSWQVNAKREREKRGKDQRLRTSIVTFF